MPATIGPDVAAAAVALARSHPHAPPLDAFDVMVAGHAGAALDPPANPALRLRLVTVWREHVSAAFAAKCGLRVGG